MKMAPKTHGYVNIHSFLGKIAVNIIKVSKAIWQGAPPIWAMLKRKVFLWEGFLKDNEPFFGRVDIFGVFFI